MDEDSPLKIYLDAVTDLDPVARGEALLAHDTLIAAHNDAAAGGQSSSEGATLHHMICFVGINGGMTDLDSLASKPAKVEDFDEDDVVASSFKAAKNYMDRWEQEYINISMRLCMCLKHHISISYYNLCKYPNDIRNPDGIQFNILALVEED